MSISHKTNINDGIYNRIIRDSDLFLSIYPVISSVSPTDIPVIIFGEKGTKKHLFAKFIHNHSARKREKFIVIDIYNIEKQFLGDEIFGHDYGSINSLKPSKIGKIEQANGGSMLIHEIDEISGDIQSRLLEVIQHHEFHRIDGNKAIPIDVRIIATASQNLEVNVREGKFREDLYYRMAVFPIIIPPLRESQHDIEIFAKRILKIISRRLEKPINGISNEAMETLINYHWPRNFNELEEVIEYAINIEESNEIQRSSLPKALLNGKKSNLMSPVKSRQINAERILPLHEVERRALIHALKVTRNNVQLAAEALGINRATVYRKLGKYNLFEK